MDNKCNIFYLTSRCNFDCEYCYEKKNRDKLENQIDSTEIDIDNFIKEILIREKNNKFINITLFGRGTFFTI